MLDTLTLIIVLIGTYLFQSIVLLVMSTYLNAYRSVRLWGFGSLVLSLGLFTIYLRSFDNDQKELILLTNFLFISGLFMYYAATKKLLNISYKTKTIGLNILIYVLLIAVFTYWIDSLHIRIALFSYAVAGIVLKMVLVLKKYTQESSKRPANFLIVLFMIVVLFMFWRGTETLFDDTSNNVLLAKGLIQDLSILFAVGISVLWTIGIVVLTSNMLQTDLSSKTEELQKISSERDKVFSILSHDLRGPINTITSFTDLMADETFRMDGKKFREVLLSLQRTAHSTSILLENILDWSRMIQQNTTFHPQQSTYKDLMIDVMGLLKASAENKQIEIHDSIPKDTIVVADRRMFQATFRNLLANAIKFTPPGGVITLSSYTNDEGKTVFCVKDNGIGMTPEMLKIIFNNASGNTQRGTIGETGSGLGLSLCKEFVEKHGGNIWVTSEACKGSTFYFTMS